MTETLQECQERANTYLGSLWKYDLVYERPFYYKCVKAKALLEEHSPHKPFISLHIQNSKGALFFMTLKTLELPGNGYSRVTDKEEAAMLTLYWLANKGD